MPPTGQIWYLKAFLYLTKNLCWRQKLCSFGMDGFCYFNARFRFYWDCLCWCLQAPNRRHQEELVLWRRKRKKSQRRRMTNLKSSASKCLKLILGLFKVLFATAVKPANKNVPWSLTHTMYTPSLYLDLHLIVHKKYESLTPCGH